MLEKFILAGFLISIVRSACENCISCSGSTCLACSDLYFL